MNITRHSRCGQRPRVSPTEFKTVLPSSDNLARKTTQSELMINDIKKTLWAAPASCSPTAR